MKKQPVSKIGAGIGGGIGAVAGSFLLGIESTLGAGIGGGIGALIGVVIGDSLVKKRKKEESNP